ncbi:MAG: diguanylate cyclase [Nitrospiria bacterium]
MSQYDILAWKSVQDHLARLTGCSLSTFDTSNEIKLFCEESQENPLCELIHKTPELRSLCDVERETQIHLADQSEQRKYFKCYANLNLFAIPLPTEALDRKDLIGGKVYFSYQELEDFKKKTAGLKISPHFIAEKADEIKVIHKELFVSAGQLIESVALSFFKNLSAKKISDNRSNKLNTLLNLSQELDQNLGERDFYGLFLNALGILFNGETVAVLKPDPLSKDYKTFEAFGNKFYEMASFTGKKDNPLLKKVFENQRPYATRDILEIVKAGFPEETGALHLFPVGKPGKTLALLVFLDTDLSEEDIKLIRLFSRQISIILENQFLFETVRNYRKDSKTLTAFSHLLVSTLDADELFKTIIDQATSMLHAEQGSLMLLEEETGDMKIKVIKGMNHKIVEERRIQTGEGVAGKVLQEGMPLLVQNMETDPRVLLPKRSRYKTASFISVPIIVNHRPIGILNVADKSSEPFFTEKDLQVALTISGYASMAIERSEFYRRSEELRQISITDTLSGLLNRRYFQERLAEEMERSKRHKLPLSLIIMDIDNFKQFNDLHGHLAGDEAIRIVGRCLRNNIRTIDVAARYGGEEFTVILPQTGKADATQIAQRVCLEIGKTECINEGVNRGAGITVSLGLATFPEDAESIEDLFKDADQALYMAKAAGKNRVIVYTP